LPLLKFQPSYIGIQKNSAFLIY